MTMTPEEIRGMSIREIKDRLIGLIEVTEDAEQLTRLLDHLQSSPDLSAEQWKELEARYHAYRQGSMPTMPWEAVKQRLHRS